MKDENGQFTWVRDTLKYDYKQLAYRNRHAGYSIEDRENLIKTIAIAHELNGSMGETSIMRGAGDHKELSTDYYTWLHNQIVAPAHNASLDGDMMDLSARLSYPLDKNGELREKVHVIPDDFVLTSPMFKRVRKHIGEEEKFHTVYCSYDITKEKPKDALKRIIKEAEEAAAAGKHVILSDEKIGKIKEDDGNGGKREADYTNLPMTIATGVVHTALNKAKTRGDVGIFVKSAECKDANQVGLFKAAGATAVVPYLAEQNIVRLQQKGQLKDPDGKPLTIQEAMNAWLTSMRLGTKVIMQRTLTLSANSMQGAMQFEANGLAKDLVNQAHPGVPVKQVVLI